MRNIVLSSPVVLAMVAMPALCGAAVIASEDFESPVITGANAYSYNGAGSRTDGTVLPDIWPLGASSGYAKLPAGTGSWDLTVVDDSDNDGTSIGDVGVFSAAQNKMGNGTQVGYTNIQDFCTYQIQSNANLGLGNLAATTYTLTMDTRTNIGTAVGSDPVTDRTVQIGLVAGGVELGTFDSVSLSQNTNDSLTYTLTAAQATASGQIGQPLSIRIKGSFLGTDTDNSVSYVGQVYYDNIVVKAVPEPSSLALLGLGAIFTCLRRRLVTTK